MPLPVIDTRPYFRALGADVVTLFRSLTDEEWVRPTVAGAWRVRDVAAHLTDTALRRLSFHRDGRVAASQIPLTDRDLARLVNDLNASWVHVAARFSPAVLIDLYALASALLADFVAPLDLHARARFPVSWAGQSESPQWLDIGREFTEIWHHGSQIRNAVHRGPFAEARWLRAVLDIAMHAVPPAYRRDLGDEGGAVSTAEPSVTVHVTGRSGGTWTVTKHGGDWTIDEGEPGSATTLVTLSDDTAWRLLFNGLSSQDVGSLITIEGDRTLALPLLRTRALVL